MEEMSNESWESLNNTTFIARETRQVLGLVVQMTPMDDLGLSKALDCEDGYGDGYEYYALDS